MIIIADDHPLYREALTARVERLFPEATIRAVDSLDEALSVADQGPTPARLFLLDYHMPGVSQASLREVVEQYPQARVAVISGTADPDEVRGVIHAGVHGFIPKTANTEYLQLALQMLLAGGTSVPTEYLLAGPAHLEPEAAPWATSLTEREMEVMRALSRGLSNKEIGRELGLAEVTVKLHMSSIFRKTGAHTRAEAAVLATKHGL
jgi:DNA-binding NarL/FixJ family response regulator